MVEKSFRRSVPSLTALVALDAAVRHRSFTLAASELGVTQTAVSRQIIALEADLGAPCFTDVIGQSSQQPNAYGWQPH